VGLFGPNVSDLHNAGIHGSKLSASICPEFVLCLAILACSVSPTKTTAIICNHTLISRPERKARWKKESIMAVSVDELSLCTGTGLAVWVGALSSLSSCPAWCTLTALPPAHHIQLLVIVNNLQVGSWSGVTC